MKKTQDLHQQAVSGFLQGWLQAPWPEDLGTVNLPSWTISDPLNQLFWVKLEAAFFMYFQEDSHVQEPFQVKTGPMSYILLREEVTQYTHMSKIIIYNVYFMYLTEKREREREQAYHVSGTWGRKIRGGCLEEGLFELSLDRKRSRK